MENVAEAVRAQLHPGHNILYAIDVKETHGSHTIIKALALVVNGGGTHGQGAKALFLYTRKRELLYLEYVIPIYEKFEIIQEKSGGLMGGELISLDNTGQSTPLDLLVIPTDPTRVPIIIQCLHQRYQDTFLHLMKKVIREADIHKFKAEDGYHSWVNEYRSLSAMYDLDLPLDQQSVHPGDNNALSNAEDGIEKGWLNTMMWARRHEYTTKKPLRIFIGTWNVAGQTCNERLDDWICLDKNCLADIVVVGFQETDLSAGAMVRNGTFKQDEWNFLVKKTLAKYGKYTMLDCRQLVGIVLVVYALNAITPYISDIESSLCGVGLMNRMGNKGAVSIRFQVHNTTVCFVCCHLAAHLEYVERRNWNYSDIQKRLVFLPRLGLSKPMTIMDHDMVFWLGDLNYRIVEMDIEDVKQHIAENNLTKLIQYDQLMMERAKGNAFHSFKEMPITFPPTFKFDIGTDDYDTSEKQRCPAWTDRILYHGQDEDITQGKYRSHPELVSSDHKPVSAYFDVKVNVVNNHLQSKVHRSVWSEIEYIRGGIHPEAVLSTNNITFDDVRFMEIREQSLFIRNTGLVPIHWRFVAKANEKSCCKSMLRIEPQSGELAAGDSATITFIMNVDPPSATNLNNGTETLEDILILHLNRGRDFYVVIDGNYLITPFGTALEDLVENRGPVRNPSNKWLDGDRDLRIHTRQLVPRELMRLCDYITEYGLDVPQIFRTKGSQTEILAITECLATGDEFDRDLSIHSYAGALLLFLRSLPVPVLPNSIRDRAIQCCESPLASAQLVRELPLTHCHTFTYLVQLAKSMLTHRTLSGHSFDRIASILWGMVTLPARASNDPSLTLLADQCKIAFLRPFLLDDS